MRTTGPTPYEVYKLKMQRIRAEYLRKLDAPKRPRKPRGDRFRPAATADQAAGDHLRSIQRGNH